MDLKTALGSEDLPRKRGFLGTASGAAAMKLKAYVPVKVTVSKSVAKRLVAQGAPARMHAKASGRPAVGRKGR